MEEPVVIVDEPAPRVRRLTLNRPQKRNAINNAVREQLFTALREADADREASAIVICGAGPCFSSGYDLGGVNEPVERHAAKVDGWWPRHVVAGWFEMWDMGTPIIAQVHGWCLAGGSELATACDLVYVADDATIGYPAVRSLGAPDMAWQPWLLGFRRGMEALLTGDGFNGTEAAQIGFANRSVPAEELEDAVLDVAQRIAQTPTDILALLKRTGHRAMEAAGMRDGIRATTELHALGVHQRSVRDHLRAMRDGGVKAAITDRDSKFGDYSQATPPPDAPA